MKSNVLTKMNTFCRLLNSDSATAIPLTQVETIYRNCRQLQLFMVLFNELNSGTLWGTKVVYMAFAIQCAFLAIRHFKSNIFLGIFSYFALFNIIFVYAILFDTAYKIPVKISTLHEKLMLASKRLRSPIRAKLVGQQAKALHAVRFKVGELSGVERNSSLVFIGFVVTQVVALLVSFR